MDSLTIWVITVATGIGTFALRLSFIQLAGRFEIPERFRQALRFVPAAVLSAIILPAAMRSTDGGIDMALENPRFLAAVAAALIAWATKSVLATLAGGMAVLWLLDWLT